MTTKEMSREVPRLRSTRRCLAPMALLGVCAILVVPQVAAQSVKLNKSCFTPGEDLTITYVNRNRARGLDWVGVFLLPQLGNGQFQEEEAWLRLCGSQGCSVAKRRGSVTIRDDIPVGNYKAILSRDEEAPYSAYAISVAFSVQNSCAGGGGGTAPSPTPQGPVPTSTANNANEKAATHLKAARQDIESIVRNDPALGATFLRLIFHDCVGGCDGCVDMGNGDNSGLQGAIDILSDVVNRHATPESGLSRTDIWMMAGIAGPAVMQRDNSRVDFPFRSYGRVDCEKTGAQCRNANGETVACAANKGPHRNLPGTNFNTHDVFSFFAGEFGFSQRETVAIMGGHTIGQLKFANSGIDGPNGWALSKHSLDNEFYEELVGGGSTSDSTETKVNNAPEWVRARRGDKRLWIGTPQNTEIIMLNSDIALVRNLDDSNYDKSLGRASCTFEDSSSSESVSVCPHVGGALDVAAEFKHDNIKWLNEFRDVLDRMIHHGYSRQGCSNSVCKLNRK